ncbi:MAG: hypothetical protein LBG80_04430 [Bacteroidales bacterium]|jgi:hypothetical protein|nr:hypothetical protein [Bacteroidales bacterium]
MEYNFKFEYPKQKNPDEDSVQKTPDKTPTRLMVLCILTFIWSGFSLLAYLIFFFMYHSLLDMMTMLASSMENSLPNYATYYNDMAEMFRNTPQYFFLLMTIPCLLSIAGSGCMIRMRKLGFHLYVVGQILLLGFPILIQKQGFGFFELLLSIVFIALYSSYLKRMR